MIDRNAFDPAPGAAPGAGRARTASDPPGEGQGPAVLFARVGAPRPDGSRPLALGGLDGRRELAGAAALAACAGATVVVPRRSTFELWWGQTRRTSGDRAEREPGAVLGLDELAAWLAPGGLGADLERLLLQRAGARGGLEEAGPAELARATRALVETLHGLPLAARAALARAWEEAGARLAGDAPGAGARLARLARLVDRPGTWWRGDDDPFGAAPGGASLEDGRVSGARGEFGDLDMALAEALPGWATEVRPGGEDEGPVPPDRDGVAPLSASDRALVTRAFTEVLPELGGSRVARGGELSVRPAQVDVAESVAGALGTGRHLLLHAPTGTGKTLAYLVPGLLFAVRNGVRVGFATYTKALQRQAYDRDLPLALEVLRRLAVEPPRVAVLKGRSNYVCWRALVSLAPGPSDSAARHLAFCHLLAFALGSPEGDLDQLPRAGLELFDGVDGLEHEWELLRRTIGARTGCCSRPHDRGRCGADAARRRAERSHGVLTNHAFALARPEFLRHVVFDECEHLHDQAHAAFSRSVTLARARRRLDDLVGGGRRPLEVLRRSVSGALAFGAVQADLERALSSRTRARVALDRLTGAAHAFVDWRREREGERDREADHALLREFVETGLDEGRPSTTQLLASHDELCRALTELAKALGALSETLFEVPVPRRERVRFGLDHARVEVQELVDAVAPWLPQRDGRPAFDPGTFYDVVEREGGELALETRVLLPHEVLGRFHYPRLAGAVFLSATTRLRGGFDDARRYLGLERAEHPAEDEEREPARVDVHAAPEAFDHSRVVVLAPSDVPDYRGDKAGWLEHGARLVAHLAARTGGRLLALYTNQSDLDAVAARVRPFLAARGVEVLAQNSSGHSAERLADRFRTHGSAVLLGVDSFWFGADFPGSALEYLVIAKLPYGVPDRYHHAQCAAMGRREQRRAIYLPRALARFRQGFGRLVRRADDAGCVFVLDRRFTDPRQRDFLRELPLATEGRVGARLVRAPSDRCLAEAFEHMGVRGRRGPLGDEVGAPLASTRL